MLVKSFTDDLAWSVQRQLVKSYFRVKQLDSYLIDEIHCHHKKPVSQGGTDEYKNLIIVHVDIHRLIHATKPDTITAYLNKLNLTKPQLEKLNKLRTMAGNPAI